MQVFFYPSTGICNVNPVNNPQSGDQGVLNQATLFHEALHGKLGVDDIFLETALGVSQPSANVTYYLEDNALFFEPEPEHVHAETEASLDTTVAAGDVGVALTGAQGRSGKARADLKTDMSGIERASDVIHLCRSDAVGRIL
jgi:hypothetical protein